MSYATLMEPDAGHASHHPPKAYVAVAPKEGKEGSVMFEPGDTVRVRQLKDTAPRMVVKRAVKVPHETEPGRTRLVGILCFWYLPHAEYCEQLFNTKDLEVLDRARKD